MEHIDIEVRIDIPTERYQGISSAGSDNWAFQRNSLVNGDDCVRRSLEKQKWFIPRETAPVNLIEYKKPACMLSVDAVAKPTFLGRRIQHTRRYGFIEREWEVKHDRADSVVPNTVETGRSHH